LWTLGLNGKPVSWTEITAPMPGWKFRDLDGEMDVEQTRTRGITASDYR